MSDGVVKKEIREQDFVRTKDIAERLYKEIKEVHCPYFLGKVTFNAKGLEHLKFKQKNHARIREDQFMRLKLLKYAPEILKLSKTVQGISEQKVFEFNRKNHRNEHLLVNTMFYEFVAVIDHTRVRIIVKEPDGMLRYFWSIVPFWKVDKNTGKRKLHYGSPETD